MKDFQDKTFDIVIDKACLDCLYVKNLCSVLTIQMKMLH